MSDTFLRPRFNVGSLTVSPGIKKLRNLLLLELYVDRHTYCDWSHSSEDEQEINKKALLNGNDIISKYFTPLGEILFVTNTHKNKTLVITPEEYMTYSKHKGF